MSRLLLLFFLFGACSAGPKDLSGNVFNFPKTTDTAQVKLTPAVNNFRAVTVCLRFFTDIRRDYSIFSLATPAHDNGFLLFMDKTGVIYVTVNNEDVQFLGFDVELNKWNSLCATWESVTGLGQLWLNGKHGPRKAVVTGASVKGEPIIILGQEQDTYGGKFDASQSFVGEITDVHMWDHVLTSCEIQSFMFNQNVKPGNVVNWHDLTYTMHGNVVIEKKQTHCSN